MINERKTKSYFDTYDLLIRLLLFLVEFMSRNKQNDYPGTNHQQLKLLIWSPNSREDLM